MEIQQLRALVTVLEEGSFTAAAHRLRVTQPGVSRAISALESELGMAMVQRGPGGVHATEVGESVLSHARTVILATEAIQQEASAFAGLQAGSVKVGAFPSICSRLLPETVADFEARFPGISVGLSEGSGLEVLQWVKEGAVDVGFVALPLHDSDAARVDIYSIMYDQIVVVMGREHSLAGTPEACDIRHFASEPFILPRGHHEPIIYKIFSESGIEPKIRFKVRDANSILAMVAHGLGWSLVNQMSIPTPVPTGIYVTPTTPKIEQKVGMAVRPSIPVTPTVDAFVEFVRHTSGER